VDLDGGRARVSTGPGHHDPEPGPCRRTRSSRPMPATSAVGCSRLVLRRRARSSARRPPDGFGASRPRWQRRSPRRGGRSLPRRRRGRRDCRSRELETADSPRRPPGRADVRRTTATAHPGPPVQRGPDPWQPDLGPVDWVRVGEGYGAVGARVDRDDAFEPALRAPWPRHADGASLVVDRRGSPWTDGDAASEADAGPASSPGPGAEPELRGGAISEPRGWEAEPAPEPDAEPSRSPSPSPSPRLRAEPESATEPEPERSRSRSPRLRPSPSQPRSRSPRLRSSLPPGLSLHGARAEAEPISSPILRPSPSLPRSQSRSRARARA